MLTAISMGDVARSGGIVWSSEYGVASKPPKKVTRRCPQPNKPATAVLTLTNQSPQALLVDPNLWPVDATSVMLRNIPNRYTQEDLLDELCMKGFDETFDYFHLVMDMKSKRNKGFAFLNMRTPQKARQIHAEFHNFHLRYYNSKKVVEVVLAAVQGFEANVIGYLIAHGERVQNVWFRPIIFQNHPWRAIPLKEENLPRELAQAYRECVGQRCDTHGHENSRSTNNDTSSNPGSYEENQEPLQDGEFDEISAQVLGFLNGSDGGSSLYTSEYSFPATVPESLLAVIEKPRRKRKPKKVATQAPGRSLENASMAAPSWSVPLQRAEAPSANVEHEMTDMKKGFYEVNEQHASSAFTHYARQTGGATSCSVVSDSLLTQLIAEALASDGKAGNDLQMPRKVAITPASTDYTSDFGSVVYPFPAGYNSAALFASPPQYENLPQSLGSTMMSTVHHEFFANAVHGVIRSPPGLSL